MAKVVEWFRCQTCKGLWDTYDEAQRCKNSHTVTKELWAKGKHKSVLIGACGMSMDRALFEADISDYVIERKKQLEEIKRTNPELLRKLGYFI